MRRLLTVSRMQLWHEIVHFAFNYENIKQDTNQSAAAVEMKGFRRRMSRNKFCGMEAD